MNMNDDMTVFTSPALTDDDRLTKKFYDLLMDKMTALDESATRRKYYDDFMLRRYM